MTTAAICPTWGVLRGASYYRAEQYDSDLGLYYLRARYYNPLTGRFLSRDPEDGKPIDPKTLHKYLYASGDPVNIADPRGREALSDYGAILVQKLEDVVGEEIYAIAEEVLMCKAFDIIMEEFAELKLPWWYCEVGSQ